MVEPSYINLLQKYKGKSVEELIDILEHENYEEKEKENIRRKNYEEYFDSLFGRYFIIDFNGASFILIHVNNKIRANSMYDNKFDVYNIYNTKNEIKIEKECRAINLNWFCNPYKKGKENSVREIREITEEEYNNIVEKCESVINIINNIFK